METKKMETKIKTLEKGEGFSISDKIYVKRGYYTNSKYILITEGSRYQCQSYYPSATAIIKIVEGKKYYFEAPIDTGKVVPVVSFYDGESQYKGKDMKWTEERTFSGYTEKEITVYHYSDSKIKSFADIETCWFEKESAYSYTSYGYKMVIPKGTYIERYGGGNEIRIKLEKGMKITTLKRGWCKMVFEK